VTGNWRLTIGNWQSAIGNSRRLPGYVALCVLLLSGPALAQQSPLPDSVLKPAVPDSTTSVGRDSTPYRPARSPGTAVLLSFLLPGGGQAYTGNWWKAALIAPAEVTLGYFTVKEHLAASEALSAGDSTGYVRHRDARTAFLWWTGAVVAFSMADAYVSAQMYGFDREMRLTIGPMRAGIAVGL
jgi:hypothetical protein